MSLTFICNDANSKWYFDEFRKKYIRLYADNTFKKISPHNLPNPDELLETRIQNAIRQGNTPDIEAMRPTKAVYALWKHRLANNL